MNFHHLVHLFLLLLFFGLIFLSGCVESGVQSEDLVCENLLNYEPVSVVSCYSQSSCFTKLNKQYFDFDYPEFLNDNINEILLSASESISKLNQANQNLSSLKKNCNNSSDPISVNSDLTKSYSIFSESVKSLDEFKFQVLDAIIEIDEFLTDANVEEIPQSALFSSFQTFSSNKFAIYNDSADLELTAVSIINSNQDFVDSLTEKNFFNNDVIVDWPRKLDYVRAEMLEQYPGQKIPTILKESSISTNRQLNIYSNIISGYSTEHNLSVLRLFPIKDLFKEYELLFGNYSALKLFSEDIRDLSNNLETYHSEIDLLKSNISSNLIKSDALISELDSFSFSQSSFSATPTEFVSDENFIFEDLIQERDRISTTLRFNSKSIVSADYYDLLYFLNSDSVLLLENLQEVSADKDLFIKDCDDFSKELSSFLNSLEPSFFDSGYVSLLHSYLSKYNNSNPKNVAFCMELKEIFFEFEEYLESPSSNSALFDDCFGFLEEVFTGNIYRFNLFSLHSSFDLLSSQKKLSFSNSNLLQRCNSLKQAVLTELSFSEDLILINDSFVKAKQSFLLYSKLAKTISKKDFSFSDFSVEYNEISSFFVNEKFNPIFLKSFDSVNKKLANFNLKIEDEINRAVSIYFSSNAIISLSSNTNLVANANNNAKLSISINNPFNHEFLSIPLTIPFDFKINSLVLNNSNSNSSFSDENDFYFNFDSDKQILFLNINSLSKYFSVNFDISLIPKAEFSKSLIFSNTSNSYVLYSVSPEFSSSPLSFSLQIPANYSLDKSVFTNVNGHTKQKNNYVEVLLQGISKNSKIDLYFFTPSFVEVDFSLKDIQSSDSNQLILFFDCDLKNISEFEIPEFSFDLKIPFEIVDVQLPPYSKKFVSSNKIVFSEKLSSFEKKSFSFSVLVNSSVSSSSINSLISELNNLNSANGNNLANSLANSLSNSLASSLSESLNSNDFEEIISNYIDAASFLDGQKNSFNKFNHVNELLLSAQHSLDSFSSVINDFNSINSIEQDWINSLNRASSSLNKAKLALDNNNLVEAENFLIDSISFSSNELPDFFSTISNRINLLENSLSKSYNLAKDSSFFDNNLSSSFDSLFNDVSSFKESYTEDIKLSSKLVELESKAQNINDSVNEKSFSDVNRALYLINQNFSLKKSIREHCDLLLRAFDGMSDLDVVGFGIFVPILPERVSTILLNLDSFESLSLSKLISSFNSLDFDAQVVSSKKVISGLTPINSELENINSIVSSAYFDINLMAFSSFLALPVDSDSTLVSSIQDYLDSGALVKALVISSSISEPSSNFVVGNIFSFQNILFFCLIVGLLVFVYFYKSSIFSRSKKRKSVKISRLNSNSNVEMCSSLELDSERDVD